MTDLSHIRYRGLADKVMTAEEAAALIERGSNVGMSGFTGSGYPKAVPPRWPADHRGSARGERFRVRVWTGASTGPELDGALAKADGIEFRMPYKSDPISREKINRGEMEYFDMHLSQVAPMAWQGFFGPLDIAVVEVSGITEDGALIPSSSVGNNKTWLDQAERVILEVNSWQPANWRGCTTSITARRCRRTASRSRWCGRTIVSARPISAVLRRRSWPSSDPQRRTATCLSRRRMPARGDRRSGAGILRKR